MNQNLRSRPEAPQCHTRSQVGEQIERLHKHMAELTESVEQASERFMPVLLPAPDVPLPTNKMSEPRCPHTVIHADVLAGIGDQLAAQIQRIHDLINRCEL